MLQREKEENKEVVHIYPWTDIYFWTDEGTDKVSEKNSLLNE